MSLNAQPHRPLLVLALTGLLGFLLGMIRFPTWQVAVEAAQVVAGLVDYPPDNPFYMYQVKLWTVLHQVCAVLLRAGLSEITVSRLVSGLLGMLSFQALGLLIYAFSADLLLAVGAPMLILYTRAAEHGATYPIALMGTDHTYGAIGLSLAVLVVALLGAGCYRLGALLLGMAVAVHPSLGGWLGLIVAVCVLWDSKNLRAEFRLALPYFLAGCAVAVVSLLVQLWSGRNLTSIDSSVSARYLTGFVNAWDGHRQPAAVVNVGTILNVDALVIALIWLHWFRNDLPKSSILVLRVVIVSAVLSLLFMFVSWLPANAVPTALLMLMPSRFLNFNVLAFVPLLLGLLGVYRRSLWSHLAIAAVLSALFASYRSMLWDAQLAGIAEYIRPNPWHVFVGASIGLLVVRVTPAWKPMQRRLAIQTVRAPSLAVIAVSAVLVWRLPPAYPLLDRTNDPIFAAVAAEPRGMVLTGGSFHLVQLYTRRPVLLDGGALDLLIYAPAGGPAMERILHEVYAIDFFNPPVEARHLAAIPHRLNKPVWEQFSRQKWVEIGRTFNVTQVLTRADWSLDLPIAAEDRRLKLYRVP